MTQRTSGRKRHLSLVPDLPTVVGLDDLDLPLRAVSTLIPVPPLVEATAEDLRRRLAESGAPQPFLDYAVRFGDDAEGLAVWLRDYGPVFSEKQWATDLLDHWSPFLEPGTAAIAAEQFGASFLAMYDEDSVGMIKHLIAEVGDSGRSEAVAMARVFASVGPVGVQAAAVAAAERLVADDVPDVPWAGDIGAGRFIAGYGWSDPPQSEEMLVLEFEIAGRPFSFSILIDHSRGSGIKAIALHDDITKTRRQFEVRATVAGFDFLTYSQAQAGSILTVALDAPVAARRSDDVELVNGLAPLLRSREHLVAPLSVSAPAAPPAAVPPAAAPPAAVPPAAVPRPATRVSQVHRIKVSVADTKPPIWRRLEVSSAATLQHLHQILQGAFGWSDEHAWVFETAGGDYGVPDPGTGLRDAADVTLADVAPAAGAKLAHLYEFGDNSWRHCVVVEAVEAATVGPRYPRATGGRRAAPPEDCGGSLRYEELRAEGSITPPRFSLALVNESLRGL